MNPTYHNLGNHSESIEIDYDPTVVSYQDLLKIFWEGHDPGAGSWSTQYKAAIFYRNDEQKRLAEETRETIGAARKIKGANGDPAILHVLCRRRLSSEVQPEGPDGDHEGIPGHLPVRRSLYELDGSRPRERLSDRSCRLRRRSGGSR